MTEDNARAAGINVAFRVSRAKRLHGLVIAGVLAAVGLLAMFAAGPALPDGQLIGLVNLALAGGVVVYVLRTAWNPGVGMVLDDDGLWFRDWGLPPVPWRHVHGAYMTGIRLRPLLCVELGDADVFLGQIDAATRRRCRNNPLVRPPRLMVPNGALDAPLTDVMAAIREARGRAPAVAVTARARRHGGAAKAHAPRHTVGRSKRASSRGDR